jgi:hypothetical protein
MSEERIPRRLKVDLSELEVAFDDASWERNYYLDLETSKVLMVTEEIRQELERIYEEAIPEDRTDEEADLTPILDRLQSPQWEKEALREANQVEEGFGTRYISIPRSESTESYGDMEEFITMVEDEHLVELLEVAINGKGAFRRFKDVLANYPAERERWFHFKDNRIRERVLEWLKDEGIELIGE